jgi:antitoxin component YwqK of YwqJK toxin-antitoxin module
MSEVEIQRINYESGALQQEVPFIGDKIHGTIREWHENGVLSFEIPMHEGMRHGVCKQWDERGELLGAYEMDMGTGCSRRWHPNGRLQFEGNMIREVFHGPTRVWDADGKLTIESFYLSGKEVSKAEYERASISASQL